MKLSLLKKTTKAITLLFLLFIANQAAFAQGNNFIILSGTIIDQDTKLPIQGASVTIKNSISGTATNEAGKFELRTKSNFPLKITVSSLGFKSQEFEVKGIDSKLNISLVTQTQLGQEVVVTASRVEENILKSPVAIEKLDIRAIRESPSPSFYDALGNVKGVQMTTSSLTFKVPNTRGFNIPNNFRFVQLVDGIDMQAATLGVPLGNAIGPTELDIASVEITPGAASALYGMNAINGMANLLTKNPFYAQGLSFYQKTGLNHVGGTGRDLSNLTETAIRYAKAFNNKFAFKVNLDYLRGTDWVSDSRNNQNPNNLNTANPTFSELNADADNPAYDAWNKYGDDSGSNAVTLSGLTVPGKTGSQSIIVRRTGYYEKDLVNPVVDNLKFDAALHYRIHKNAELSYGYRVGKMDGVFQRGNKIQLDNVIIQNHKLELKGSNYFIKTYVSTENTGDSYNLKPLVDNLDITSGGTNSVWGAKYKTAFQNAITAGKPLADALKIGRTAADAGRAEPGTPYFEQLKSTIIGINNWDNGAVVAGAPATGGAWLKQKSRTYHSDAQLDLSKYVKVFDLLVGADARVYEVVPDGNNFVDFSRPIADRNKPLANGSFGSNVYYKKFGGFTQITKTFFEEKLKLFASLRLDYNPEFQAKLNPRIAAVYTLAEKHNFRASIQNGFRFPALFEALSFVNNGNIRRVGGLSYINDGLNYLDNSYTLTSINAFNAAVNTDVATGLTATAAALKNRALLETTSLSATRPERINSFEVGYKSVLLENKLVIDIDAYSNVYSGFLGQVEVAVPYLKNTTNPLSTQAVVGSDDAVIAALAANRTAQQTRYRVYTNAKNDYNNYGSSLGLTYSFFSKYTVASSVSYNSMTKNTQKDVFVTGFNTPNWSTNVSFGNREIVKNLGFNVVWKWQNAFLWESPLVTGQVDAFNTYDAQLTYKVPSAKANIKIGGTNILNKKYIQYAGGPTLGGLYYAAITFDGLLN